MSDDERDNDERPVVDELAEQRWKRGELSLGRPRSPMLRWDPTAAKPRLGCSFLEHGRSPAVVSRHRTDRRFCARVECWLARRFVRLWGEHRQPRLALMAASGRVGALAGKLAIG
jgi:hypothetical protein